MKERVAQSQFDWIGDVAQSIVPYDPDANDGVCEFCE